MSHPVRRPIRAIALALCLLAACSSPEERFEDHFERGEELASRGKIDRAILEYRSALKIDPSSIEAHLRLADQLMRRDDLNAAFYLHEAARLAPERLDIAAKLARVLMATGRVPDAKTMIAEGLEAHPDSAALHGARAELLLYENEPAAALDEARRAVELAPEDPDLWVQLGRVHTARIRMAQLKNETPADEIFDEAIAAFDRADELAGGDITARVRKARVLGSRAATLGEAPAVFAEAAALAEERGDAYERMVVANVAADFAAEAKLPDLERWALREMLAVDDTRLDVWARLAASSDRPGGPGSEIVYTELLAKRPDDPTAHAMYVNHLTATGREREALEHVSGVVDRELGSPVPWEQLIRLQIRFGRVANARAAFVRMTEEFPDDPVTRRTAARLAIVDRRYGDAVEILRPLAAKSNEFETQRLLALAEYRGGNLPNAAAAVERALALNPGSVAALRLKARIHQDSREWNAVLAALDEIHESGARMSGTDWLMRVRALYETDRIDAGRVALHRLLTRRDAPVPAAAAVEYAKREGRRHPRKAMAYLERALAKHPGTPAVLEALVALDLRQGRANAAIQRLNTAIESGRARPSLLLLRAQVLTKAGALDQAEADALRAFEADPTLPGAVDLLYAIYRAQGRLDEARKSFEEADEAGVLHSGARLLLGRIYLEEGDTERATATFERIIRENPEVTAAKNDLAYLLAQNDQNLDRALELAEEAQQSMSTNPYAADTVGYVYYRRGLHEAALQQFRYALELNDNRSNQLESILHYHRGLALEALDRPEEARAAFRRAIEIDANSSHAEDARRRIEAVGRSATGDPQPT